MSGVISKMPAPAAAILDCLPLHVKPLQSIKTVAVETFTFKI